MAESSAAPLPAVDVSSLGQLKTMFTSLLTEAKDEILSQVKTSIDQVYADFEIVDESESRDNENTGLPQTSRAEISRDEVSLLQASEPGSDVESRASLADKVDALSSRATEEHPSCLKSLVKEFTPVEKTSGALQSELAELVNGLINDKLPKEKLAQLQEKYLRPENCPFFLPPRINKQLWQQLRQETRNADSALQKTQGLLIAGLYAVLHVCQELQGKPMDGLIHAVVLLLSANREFNLKRRELLRADLNKQYVALCNPSTAISTFLFGDDLNKEVEDLTKSNRLSGKVHSKPRFEPYRPPSRVSRLPSRFGTQDRNVRSQGHNVLF